jgi:response regulator RpfG family c-di-GMP phosphodiesterase
MTNEKILCVDDDPIILFAIEKDLRHRFPVVTALSGEQALSLIKNQGPFGVILADMLMPGMNGVELLAQAQRMSPDSVRIMLTGDEDKQTAVEAINEGRIFRFLSKPCPPDKLSAAIEAGFEQYRLIIAEKELLEQTLNGSVKMLTELLSVREPEAFGRGQKIREYVATAAPAVNLTKSWDVEVAAMLAQIGLMAIPPSVMQKVHAGLALTEREKDMMIRIPEIGFNVLAKIPRLEPAAKIVLYQNKNFDGSGFPKEALDISRIPHGARLLKIVSDLVDLESKGVPKRKAFDQMRLNRRFYDMAMFEGTVNALIAQEAPANGHMLRLAELRAGHELMSAVETLEGRLIAPAGTVVSQMMLERFHNFAELSGIKEPIYVKFK